MEDKKRLPLLKKKKSLAFVVLLFLFTFAVILIVIHLMPKTVSIEKPALKVGQTSLSVEDYNKLVASAKGQGVDEPKANDTIQVAYKYKEVARQLDLVIPDYLVAAQAQTVDKGNIYTVYDQLTDYEKIAAYPKAFYTVISLMETGGSIISIFHAPYDTSTNSEVNRQYAEQQVQQVSLFKTGATEGETGKAIYDPLTFLMTSFSTDEHSHYNGAVNQSQITGLNDAGQLIRGSDEQYIQPDKLPITTSLLAPSIVAVARTTKEGQLSSVTKLPDQDAYVVIFVNKTYPKDTAIKDNLAHSLQVIGG